MEEIVSPEEKRPAEEGEPRPDSPLEEEEEEQGRIQALEKEKEELWARYIRLQADFENYRKRAQKERWELIASANEELIRKLLPVLDHLELALAAPGSEGEIKKGVAMTLEQLKGILAEEGLKPITAVGQPFDPFLHEALTQVYLPETPAGTVVEELRRGYRFRERVLRPSLVKVAGPPPPEGAVQDAEAKNDNGGSKE
ncbi:MAG: nucleotide exchange factor GrpE [Bacillota bacterium]|nr:nucleotide exchange factor GrpE [Bacillota bacterium]